MSRSWQNAGQELGEKGIWGRKGDVCKDKHKTAWGLGNCESYCLTGGVIGNKAWPALYGQVIKGIMCLPKEFECYSEKCGKMLMGMGKRVKNQICFMQRWSYHHCDS